MTRLLQNNFLKRAVFMMLAIIMTCASAWAQNNVLEIYSTDDWNTFAANVNNGTNNYNGWIVALKNDISVTTSVGEPSNSNHHFQGTFNGQGHTLTFNSSEYLAPFGYTKNATIQNLKVEGDIYTSESNPGGIVGHQNGNLTLRNCRSSVNIHCSRVGACGAGGLIGAVTGDAVSTTIEGCLFNGSLLSVNSGENLSTTCGGFIGSTSGTCSISNSLLAPTSVTIGYGNDEHISFIFARIYNTENVTISNSYWMYDTEFGSYQGLKAHTITAGENISVAFSGEGTNYSSSAITSYTKGIKYHDVLYAGNNSDANYDVVSLTLGNTPATGYTFNHYEATAGTLTGSGNTYSLTMPREQDVVINGVFNAPVPYMNADGSVSYKPATEYTVLTGGSATTLAAGWYVVNSDINYNGKVTLNGDVTIILCDGCTMNVGTEESPISGQGLRGQNLTIYGQTFNENAAGQLNVYATLNYSSIVGLSNYVQNSGNVNVINSGTNEAYGIEASFTINGGKLYVRGVSRAIGSSNIYINGGKVTTIASIYNYSNDSNPTIISWTNADDYVSTTSFNGRVNLAKTFTDGTYIHSGKADTEHSYGIQGKTIRPCVTRTVAAWDNTSNPVGGWAFISSPLTSTVNPTTINYATTSSGNTTIQGSMILTGEDAANYDLYRFNQSATSEWENYKAHTLDFNFVNGQGYLYANKDAKTLVFSGDNLNTSTADVEVNMPYAGWNLVGNPFCNTVYANKDFYVMNEAGSEINVPGSSSDPIPAIEGIFVQATEANQKVTFSTTAPSKSRNDNALVINLNSTALTGSATVIDRAIVRFGESEKLSKFQLFEGSTKIYIPQNGEDYAIAAMDDNTQAFGLNFHAKNTGEYTLSLGETSNLSYIHLFDRMTGEDIDMLLEDSYSFIGSPADSDERFIVRFSPSTSSTGSETFAFQSGSDVIVNGEGELQIFDVMGRMVKTTAINGIETINMPNNGVYIFRLEGKIQKIVIR